MTKCATILLVICLVLAARAENSDESPSEQPAATEEEEVEPFNPPSRPPGDVYFIESFFDESSFNKNWVKSKATKSEDDSAKYNGEWKLATPTFVGANKADIGLQMPEAHRLYAISSKLERNFVFNKEQFVVQFEVNFQEGLQCGGAYVKLLSSDDNLDLTQFQDKTPYSIMFGPDKCGQSSKIHFIVRFKNPVTGEIEEKHSKQYTGDMGFFDDKLTHLFTLFIRKDDYFSISVDQQALVTGYLYSDLTPSIVPPKEIDDPKEKKPEDWDERKTIPDPDAVKPDDWDEDAPMMIPDPDATKPDGWLDDGPETIPDPDASRPDDWDDDEDGEWEPPTIDNPACEAVGCGEWTPPEIHNPAYKGKWKAPMIDNPNFMGIWAPQKIPNPSYFELEGTVFSQLTSISAVGFELWTVSKAIHFDNIVITSEITSASALALKTWIVKNERERKATASPLSVTSWVDYFIEIANNYPYLWGLYAVILVLPFVFCAACCVRTSKPSTRDEVGRRKKTDQPTKDDDASKPKTEDKSFVASADDEVEATNDKSEKVEEKPLEEPISEVKQRKKKKPQPEDPPVTTDDKEPEVENTEEYETKKSPRRGGGRKAKSKRED